MLDDGKFVKTSAFANRPFRKALDEATDEFPVYL